MFLKSLFLCRVLSSMEVWKRFFKTVLTLIFLIGQWKLGDIKKGSIGIEVYSLFAVVAVKDF